MFGITGLSARIAVLGIVSAILFGIGYYACYRISYLPERDAYTKFVAQTEQIGKTQAEQAKLIDEQHQKEIQDAEKNTVEAVNSIAEYYKLHPSIRVQYTSSGCSTMPEAASNSESTDAASTAGLPASYISPYDPERTEQIANQLDQLQKLLISYGVTVQ